VRAAALSLALCVAIAGCASRGPVLPPQLGELGATPLPAPVELADTPFFPQARHQCGPAALATVLVAAGVAVGPDELTPEVYLPARQGSLQVEIMAATRRRRRIPYVLPPRLSALFEELRAGRAVLVLQNLAVDAWPVWHYAVVIGMDPRADRVVLRSGSTRREVVPARRFLERWERAGRWAMVALRPGELPAAARRQAYLEAVADMERVASPRTLQAAYRAALERWPADPAARFGLARALHAGGDLAGAARAYEALLAAHPDHPAVLNNLAMVYADQGRPARALEAVAAGLARAGEGHPLRGTLLDTRRELLGRRPAAGP
jgi:hypothetical protein